MDIYKELKLKDNHVLQIFQDSWADTPRSWDNFGTMAIFHKKYNFGDDVDFKHADFDSWEQMEKHIRKNLKAAIVLPIYMYDHSGITIRTYPFTCVWDSGQIGFIYATKEKIKKEYDVKRISQVVIEKVEKILENEVIVMDKYITGDIYGFQLIKQTDTEDIIIDSCTGFYGEDIQSNGMLEHINSDLLIS
jgi:hypothetical protein